MDLSGFGDMSPAEPSMAAQILEKVFMVLAFVVLFVLIILAGRMLWRRLKKLLRQVLERLKQYSSDTAGDYEDEAIDTRNDDSASRVNRRKRRPTRYTDLQALPPREKIRASLRMMRQQDSSWQDFVTARDMLPREQAAVYEEARYSTHDVTPEQADAFSRFAKERAAESRRKN